MRKSHARRGFPGRRTFPRPSTYLLAIRTRAQPRWSPAGVRALELDDDSFVWRARVPPGRGPMSVLILWNLETSALLLSAVAVAQSGSVRPG
jgi:hypothetical protein